MVQDIGTHQPEKPCSDNGRKSVWRFSASPISHLIEPEQVAADQFMAAPCLVGLFFTAMPILEGKPNEIQERLATVS